MGPRHLCQVDGLAILAYGTHGAISLVVSEAVLYAYDDPAQCMSAYVELRDSQCRTYHRLVKTTPKPSATKNSRGELPGVLLFFPESVGVAVGAAEAVLVASAMFDWC